MARTDSTSRIATGFACLALLFLAACKDEAPATPPAPPPAEVGVVTVKPQRVEVTTELPGRTSPFLIAEVRPQVGGIVRERSFKEGSEVKAGDTLYLIDPASYQAAYDAAAAKLSRSEATMRAADSRARRQQELVRTNVASRQTVEDAVAALDQAKADVAADKAALAAAKIDLDHTRVTAPISGRIGRSTVTQGALVTASQAQPLAVIQTLDTIHVDIAQSSVNMLRLRRSIEKGQLSRGSVAAKVELLLEDGTRYPHEGKLEFADVTVDETTGTIIIRATFPNPDRLLLPGMYVRAVVIEGVDEAAMLVPQRGVTRNAKGEATALVVLPDGKVEQRVLQVRRTLGDAWLVDGGVKPGEQVIVEGLQKTRPGGMAKPSEVAAKPADAAAAPAAAAPAPKPEEQTPAAAEPAKQED